MKNLNYSLLRIVCALVVGLILVLFTDRAGEYLVITLGVVFVVPALAGIITYFVQRHKGNMYFPLEGVGSLLFGLWLIVMPDFFCQFTDHCIGYCAYVGRYSADCIVALSWTLHESVHWFLHCSSIDSDSGHSSGVQPEGHALYCVYDSGNQQSGLCFFGDGYLVRIQAAHERCHAACKEVCGCGGCGNCR